MVFLATKLPPYILCSQNVTNVVLSITKTLNKKRNREEKNVFDENDQMIFNLFMWATLTL